MSTDQPLLSAIHTAAQAYNLPPLLLKAFVAVGGKDGPNAAHPDGLMRLIPPTRGEIIPKMSRAYKLLALGLSDDHDLHDTALNEVFASAYANGNLIAQMMCGAHQVQEQLARFGGLVALAGLAYSAGSGAANRLVARMGGNLRQAAALYHRRLGPAPSQASQTTPQTDADIGAWLDYSVIANDTGQAIPNYGYLRQVPEQGDGLLDFVFRPDKLAAFGLLEDDTAPGCAEENCILWVDSVYKTSHTYYNPERPSNISASILKGLP